MTLSPNQIAHRCLYGQGAHQCRYLTYSWMGGAECIKLLPGRKKAADSKAAKFIADCQKNHVDPWQQWQAIGNGGGNCKGYLYLSSLLQGYDQSVKK